jgi:hypothetical protein
MKPTLTALFVLNLTLMAHATSEPSDKPVITHDSGTQDLSPAPATTAAPMAPPQTEMKEKERAFESGPVEDANVTSPEEAEPTTPAIEVASATPKALTAETTYKEAPAAQPEGYVAALQSLVTFHEGEIASLKNLIDRWNGKARATLQHQADVKQAVQANLRKIDALQKQNTKNARKDAASLKRDNAQSAKDLRAIGDELKAQRRELVTELQNASQASQQSSRDAYQRVIAELRKPQN